ncbi:MAG: SRPBCC family protein [Phycicoccus sp.]
MIEVTCSSSAPADRLWAVMSAVRDWPAWLPTVDTVTPLEPQRPDEVGAAYRVEQPRLPPAVWRITEVVTGRSFTWESSAPGVRSTAIHVLRPNDDGTTTITLGVRWSGPLAPLVRLLLGRMTRAYVEREARALDRVASGGA